MALERDWALFRAFSGEGLVLGYSDKRRGCRDGCRVQTSKVVVRFFFQTRKTSSKAIILA